MQISKVNEAIEQLIELLKLEKEEDFERFREEVLLLSLKEKKKKGVEEDYEVF